MPHNISMTPVNASSFDVYTNDSVKCECGSNKRVVRLNNLIYYPTQTSDGFQRMSEICYDCGRTIEYEVKYTITADVRNVNIKNKGE